MNFYIKHFLAADITILLLNDWFGVGRKEIFSIPRKKKRNQKKLTFSQENDLIYRKSSAKNKMVCIKFVFFF